MKTHRISDGLNNWLLNLMALCTGIRGFQSRIRDETFLALTIKICDGAETIAERCEGQDHLEAVPHNCIALLGAFADTACRVDEFESELRPLGGGAEFILDMRNAWRQRQSLIVEDAEQLEVEAPLWKTEDGGGHSVARQHPRPRGE